MSDGGAPATSDAAASDDAAPPATPSRVTIGESGLFLVNDQPAFPIGLSMGPPPGSTAPSGTDALDEVVAAGVALLVVTHDANVARRAARILTMQDGALV